MQVESVIGAIWARDHYAYVRLYYAIRLNVGLACIIILSLLATAMLWDRPATYRYVMTTTSGNIMPLVPLDQPNMSDESLMAWTVDAVTRIQSFDFLNYQRQFQDAQSKMTVVGWQWFEAALRESGNMTSVLANKYVVTAVPTGPARIVDKSMMVAGSQRRFTWTVEFPMLVTYRSSQRSATQPLLVRALVGRLPEYVNGDGVGIRQIIAK